MRALDPGRRGPTRPCRCRWRGEGGCGAHVRTSAVPSGSATSTLAAVQVHLVGEQPCPHERLGDVQPDEGDRAAARASYEQALAIRRRLVDTLGGPQDRRGVADLEAALAALGGT